MKPFRKLDMDLPRQPLVNQTPFMVAGWIVALTILIAMAFAYRNHRNRPAPSAPIKETRQLR